MENGNETVENLFEDEVQEKVSNAFAELPPVAPVNYEEETVSTNEIMKEPLTFEKIDENSQVNYEGLTQSENIKDDYIEREVRENPTAKVVLNQEKDEEISSNEIKELQSVRLRDNSSLKFVLLLGVIFLIAIFVIPFISNYI